MVKASQPIKRRQVSQDADAVKRATATLFGPSSNTFSLRDGTEVTVKPAKVKSFGVILDFFDKLIQRMDSRQLAGLLQLIADQQTSAIKLGLDPLSINPADPEGAARKLSEVADEDAVRGLIEKAMGHGSLFVTLLRSVFDVLPAVAEEFSNLSAAQFSELEMDEGVKVAAAVVSLNYDFFLQSFQQGLAEFLRSAVEVAKKAK